MPDRYPGVGSARGDRASRGEGGDAQSPPIASLASSRRRAAAAETGMVPMVPAETGMVPMVPN